MSVVRVVTEESFLVASLLPYFSLVLRPTRQGKASEAAFRAAKGRLDLFGAGAAEASTDPKIAAAAQCCNRTKWMLPPPHQASPSSFRAQRPQRQHAVDFVLGAGVGKSRLKEGYYILKRLFLACC